ncbi:YqgE/AlgH family protein [Reichenbachiella carrageenanivorans]|uniref:UPF0301 protein N7E81_12585 n=1 Tax=Reichenbachiella carrageenanivorans TaxID=2979869 RepID=A0ABY6CXU5_9BACT|nr:YqgE/AlgH family protein [Reichenbachiella carrageenanivorans]UXX78195.1 YqgE/AlgH family protein [Reichenbachiella carrageenanivorans]
MDYFHSKQKFTPERGDVLISEPYLPDPNFERTVVLICEHDENGTFGYVLNKPSSALLEDVVDQISDFKEKLFIGGPVQQDTLHFIHRAPEAMPSGQLIGNDIYWGGDYDQLLSMIDLKQLRPEDFRFFLGYSGWAAGQLEEELEAKSWIVYKGISASHIFDIDENSLWKEVLKSLGGKFKMFANYPADPNMN